MRLTLRNLLAYLNDELSASQTRDLGPKIAGSEVAQQLIEKLRGLTRSRRLSAPEINLNEEGSPQDPNYVAAYLDCELTEEDQAVFEKLCFEDDTQLAEVAACMQLKTLGEKDGLHVPTTSYERMYKLVKARESIHERKPPRSADPQVPELKYVSDGAAEDEEEALLLLDPLYQRVHRKAAGRWVPLAAGVCLALLAGLLYWSTQGEVEPRPFASGPAAPAAASAPDVANAKRELDAKVIAAAVRPEALVARFAGFAAARPSLPPNFLMALGEDVVALADQAKPGPPPAAERPQPEATKPIPQPPAKDAAAPETTKPAAPQPEASKPAPPAAKVAVGQYDSDPSKEGTLFRLIGAADWRPVRSQSPMLSGEPLLALTGVRATLAVGDRVVVTLLGGLPTDPSQGQRLPYVETAAELNYNPEVDLDLTLDRGRLVLERKGEGPAKVRLRWAGADLLLRLPKTPTEIGLEATGRLPVGSVDGMPIRRLALAVTKGEAEIEHAGGTITVKEKQGMSWEIRPNQPPSASPVGEQTLGWLARRPPLPSEIRDALSAFQKRLNDRIAQTGPSLPWIKVACDEALLSRRSWEQTLALSALASFGELPILIAALDDPDRAAVRKAAVESLLHYVNREPGNLERLRAALQEAGYPAADAEIVCRQLAGISQPSPREVEALLKLMGHHRLAIRQLAFHNLQGLVDLEKPGYDPAAAVDLRDRAVDQLKKRLLP